MRGQAHTLEALVAAFLLLAGVTFALQVTTVTPLSASTSSQHIENQQGATADGVLATAAETGALKRAVLFTDETGDFHNSTEDGYYTSRVPPNQFGQMLERAFESRGIVFNVYVRYQTSDGLIKQKRMVYRGVPSDNAATAVRKVTLVDDDVLYADSDNDSIAEPTTTTVKDSSLYRDAVNGESGDGLYNVVEVEVVVWRM